MGRIVFDAGMFIALGNGDRYARAMLAAALEERDELVTNANVVAQVWRGGPRAANIARALKQVDIVPVDDQLARRAGMLCGASQTSDVVDASVVAMCQTGDIVYTSDPGDIRFLTDYFDTGILAVTVGPPRH